MYATKIRIALVISIIMYKQLFVGYHFLIMNIAVVYLIFLPPKMRVMRVIYISVARSLT